MSTSLKNGTGLINAPALDGVAISPSDTVDLANASRGIYCGTAGDLTVTLYGGEKLVFVGLVGGVIHPISASRIWNTGTTAGNIVAVF
jgi:hypothetical protein